MGRLAKGLKSSYQVSAACADPKNHRDIFGALTRHLDHDNPDGLGIMGDAGNAALFSNLVSEVHLISDFLVHQGKTPADVEDMFRTMVEVWDKTDTGNPTEKFAKTAPVASLSYMARGSKVYRNALLDDIVREIGVRAERLKDGEQIVVADMGAGMGSQGQYLADKLSEAGLRPKVRIVGLGPIQAELDIAAYRTGMDGHKVFDALLCGTCGEFGNIAGRPGHVDVMMSNGVMGSFVFESEFSTMLESGCFSPDTAYMFVTRTKNCTGFMNVLREKNMIQPSMAGRVDEVKGYDLVMKDSDGNTLNRDYSLIWVNSQVENNRAKLEVGMKGSASRPSITPSP